MKVVEEPIRRRHDELPVRTSYAACGTRPRRTRTLSSNRGKSQGAAASVGIDGQISRKSARSSDACSCSSSATRRKAWALSAAASAAIEISPARSARGTRRSRAAISSSSSRKSAVSFNAIGPRHPVVLASAKCSTPRRNSCIANNYERLESSPSSPSKRSGRPDTTPVSRGEVMSRNLSRVSRNQLW